MQQPMSSIMHIAVAVVEREEHFLVGPRAEGKPLAGYWEFPGGRIESGESPTAAAVRECREETALDVIAVGSYCEVLHTYAHGRLQLHFIACQPCEPQQPPAPPFQWIARQELARLAFPPANARVLAMLLKPRNRPR